MIPKPTPARKNEAAITIAGQIIVVQVVEPPERIQSLYPGIDAVLPVNPPEVDALRLDRVVQQFKIGPDEARIG